MRAAVNKPVPYYYRGYNIVPVSYGFCVWDDKLPSRLVERDLRTWKEAERLIDLRRSEDAP